MSECSICGKKLKFWEGYNDFGTEYCKSCFEKNINKKNDFNANKKSKNEQDFLYGIDEGDNIRDVSVDEYSEIKNIERIRIKNIKESPNVDQAKLVVLTPKSMFKYDLEIMRDKLKILLLGKKLSKKCTIIYYESKKNSDFFNLDDIELGREFIVTQLKPSDCVEINENTKIKIIPKIQGEEDIPQNKIIRISKFADIKNYIKVKSIIDIIKLAKLDFYVNKFEDSEKIIYICNNYYYIEKKNNSKAKNKK